MGLNKDWKDKNLHNIIVSGDKFKNNSKQNEYNTGKAYKTGPG